MGRQHADAGNVIVHGRILASQEADWLRLAAAVAVGHVVSRCPACGHRESTDTSWWTASARDRATPLEVLRQRLRCACGSRSVLLEVWPVTPRAAPEYRLVYHWRA